MRQTPVRQAFTAKQLAQRWGCSSTTIHKMMDDGLLPFFRLGAKLKRVSASVVEAIEEEWRKDPDCIARVATRLRPAPGGSSCTGESGRRCGPSTERLSGSACGPAIARPLRPFSADFSTIAGLPLSITTREVADD